MDRVFNGSLALLSILIAVFTFAVTQYEREIGRPETQAPYFWLLTGTAALLLGSGLCALLAHVLMEHQGSRLLHWGFGVVLASATLAPFAFWLML